MYMYVCFLYSTRKFLTCVFDEYFTPTLPYDVSFPDQNDFTAGAQTITFPAGTAIAAAEDCASILTADDMILEGNHDFSVMISGSTPPNALTIGPQVDHMVTIIDDERKHN